MLAKTRRFTNMYIKEILHNKKFGRVLNLGCGSDKDKEGNVYSDYFKFDEMIKIDPRTDIAIIPIKKLKGGAVIRHIVCGGEDMPLDDNSIDFLFMLRVLNKYQSSKSERVHSKQSASPDAMEESVEKIWEECLRVLRPDSELLISYADNYGDKDWIEKCRGMISEEFCPKEVFRYETDNDHFKGERVTGKIIEVFYGKRK